jgi:raffinose/stachyose/melibiose transport system substrate-binding protein
MRKLLSLMLAMVMLLSLAMVASAEEPVVINMFISQPEYADAVRALIDAYKLVAPNVTINYETTQNDYPTLLKTKINAGECPDIFSTTSGKEIGVYLEYSYNFADQPAAAAMQDSVRSVMMSGNEVHGFALKSNYFGIVYNKAIFDKVGITEFPATVEAMKAACEKIAAAGYQPFSTGFAEWWVYKHIFQHFLDAASDNPEALVQKFIAGEAKFKDYPILYNNFFDFLDLAVKYGDAKPLETDLAGEESAIGTGKAAIILGQGAWVEGDIMNIDPTFQIGFNGYPVSDNAAQCQVISGSDQAMRIYKDSKVLKNVLDFVNWWYTSEYGRNWFCDVAGVIPPLKDVKAPAMQIIQQGDALSASNGAAAVSVSYSTDSFHQAFGEILQAYVGGTISKDDACTQIELKWVELEGGK